MTNLRGSCQSAPLTRVGSRMNVFQLIKQVLDAEYASIPGTEAARDALINARLKELSQNYRRLASTPPTLDYGEPATRLAYVFRYVTSHAHLVAAEAECCDELRELLARDRVIVSCLGGGPGSDFLGLIKHFMDTSWTGSLRAYLLDREAGWGDAWSDVGERLEEMPFGVHSHFQQLDVTDSVTWTKQRKYLEANLFTFIYFISEISALGATAEPFFHHLFASAKAGALFLFIDNNADAFVDWFAAIASRHGLELLHARGRDARLPGNEQKVDLEPYLSHFGFPKLTADVQCRVYRKPRP